MDSRNVKRLNALANSQLLFSPHSLLFSVNKLVKGLFLFQFLCMSCSILGSIFFFYYIQFLTQALYLTIVICLFIYSIIYSSLRIIHLFHFLELFFENLNLHLNFIDLILNWFQLVLSILSLYFIFQSSYHVLLHNDFGL